MYKPTITLASFSLRIEDIANLKQHVYLDNISDGKDLINFLNEILTPYQNNPTEFTVIGHMVRITNLQIHGRFIKGFFEVGRPGTEEDIINRKTKVLSYRKQIDDAMLIPHYFLFYIPEKQKKAVILLQRYKQSGIQTMLFDHVSRKLRDRFSHLKPLIKDFTDGESFRRMIKEAGLQEIRFKEHKWNFERSDQVDGATESDGSLVVSFRPKPKSEKKWMQKFYNLLDKDVAPSSVVESDFNFIKPDEVSYLLKLGKRERRISFLDKEAKFRVYHDVTDEVKIGADGYPDFQSIDKIGMDLIDNISKTFYESPSQN
jgi:hypothetical protein